MDRLPFAKPPKHKRRRPGRVTPVVYSKLIRWVFEQDGWMCQHPACGRIGGPLTAHHILPRSQGGHDHPHNLISLCPSPCHIPGMDGGLWKQHRERFERIAAVRSGQYPA